ncbi:MAG: hypothetical protein ACRCZQ_05480, partial [Bacteroidales bacterium]
MEEDLKSVNTLEAFMTLKESRAVFAEAGYPLSGKGNDLSEISRESMSGLIAEISHAYARIDIQTEESVNFHLSSAYIYKAPKEGYLNEQEQIPENLGGAVSGSEIKEDSGIISGIYTFENNGSHPTDIIIRCTNAGYPEGYYKIRVRYGADSDKKYDIRRNTHYRIKLTGIKGPGYATKDEAEQNGPGNIEYTITVTDENSHDIEITNGEYYLGVSNSEVWFYGFPNPDDGVENKETEVILTTLTMGISEGNKLPASRSITTTTPGITLKNAQEIDGAQAGQAIDIKAVLSSAAIDGEITIRVGNLLKKVIVKSRKYIKPDITPSGYIRVEDVTRAIISGENPNDFLRFSPNASQYPGSATPELDNGGGNLYLCAPDYQDGENLRRAEAFLSRKGNKGRLKVSFTQEHLKINGGKYEEPEGGNRFTTPYSNDNTEISKRANSYILPIPQQSVSYRISVQRVNDYWKGTWDAGHGAKGIFGKYVAGNTLESNSNWKPVIVWADFPVINRFDVKDICSNYKIKEGAPNLVAERYESDGINIKLVGDFSAEGIHQGKGGNIILAAAKADGSILWSWHLWITQRTSEDTDIEIPSGRKTMDRNLGAHSSGNSGNNTDSYGLLFQWGRKDAFPGSASVSSGVEQTIYNRDKAGIFGEEIGNIRDANNFTT